MLADFVRETSTTTGTGALSLGGAASSDFRTFVAALGDGSQCRYSIRNPGTGEWETGIGTITAGTPDTLSRDTVEASSNAGALVNFTAGTKDVTVSATANALLTDGTSAEGTISTGTLTLDVSSYGTFAWTVGGAHTVAFGTWPATGTAYRSLIITNGGSAAITWPTMTWLTSDGNAPTLQAAGVDTLVVWKSGAVVYGMKVGA